MPYTVKNCYGSHADITKKLENLLKSTPLKTLHKCGIVQIAPNNFLAYAVFKE